ncbi:TIGR00153 family protein [Candidatus Desantisbacteria bacterium CG1_02_38_46]|uniref:TIGR00153 family protein n=3 Tax=unclassified Candidatus Desantisiibacteriota TaxID=3106372 RepID=A0A2H9PAL0_9BACT|nr:MAG: TIGR00153 family protein [Candidatus Desantisbacteria bacterium CG1_02_38_46]PIU51418.1 MAG: TIGR00153 family protein [Candidatus Desantisbacteria bacterium CG07_land_8_20_14_0_80_39_15]PIZ15540.1 MAG: TIGR00153 family protein [Candidatus Desantisbacteria bacterium CG_4_10_14_0_8_um_filter_39_17]
MPFFYTKQNKLLKMLERYLLKIEESMGGFKKTIEVYFEKGLCENFSELVEKVHIAESSADDIRREIEIELYEKSLIPESRGDVLGLLENTDRVPDKAQSVLYQIQTEFLQIPEFLKDEFSHLVNINFDAFNDLARAIRKLFENIKEVKDITNEIDKKESASDRLERGAIKKIFSSDIDVGQKILLKELVIEIGSISDLSEEVGDRINIIAAKRMV